MNLKRPTPRHIIIKMTNIKDRDHLKGSKREKVTYKRVPIRMPAEQKHSTETFPARRGYHEVFKIMKNKVLNP